MRHHRPNQLVALRKRVEMLELQDAERRMWELIGVGCLMLAAFIYRWGFQGGLEWADGGGA